MKENERGKSAMSPRKNVDGFINHRLARSLLQKSASRFARKSASSSVVIVIIISQVVVIFIGIVAML